MKDESLLDSAGPLTIIAFVLVVVAFSGWVMIRGSGDWGKTTPPLAAVVSAEAH